MFRSKKATAVSGAVLMLGLLVALLAAPAYASSSYQTGTTGGTTSSQSSSGSNQSYMGACATGGSGQANGQSGNATNGQSGNATNGQGNGGNSISGTLTNGNPDVYCFDYTTTRQTVTIVMDATPTDSADFYVFTQNSWQNQSRTAANAIGRGTPNASMGNRLSWQGSSPASGAYYVLVQPRGQQRVSYTLTWSGAGASQLFFMPGNSGAQGMGNNSAGTMGNTTGTGTTSGTGTTGNTTGTGTTGAGGQPQFLPRTGTESAPAPLSGAVEAGMLLAAAALLVSGLLLRRARG